MSSKMNKGSYEKIVAEDIAWLETNAPNSIERRHIIEIIKDSVDFYYRESSEATQDCSAHGGLIANASGWRAWRDGICEALCMRPTWGWHAVEEVRRLQYNNTETEHKLRRAQAVIREVGANLIEVECKFTGAAKRLCEFLEEMNAHRNDKM